MYEFLEGEVAAASPAHLVLQVGGVGYDLAVPLGAAFPSSGRTRAWTHLVVREDRHQLFGFPDAPTRGLFRLLLSVRGVGPAMALGVLSGLSREELLDAIARDDPAPITRVKGVGKKTAQQILLDLRDKAEALRQLAPGAAAPAAHAAATAIEDAVLALVSIGYSDKEARKQVERAAATVDPGDLEELVRVALRG